MEGDAAGGLDQAAVITHALRARAVTSVLYASVLTISSHSVDEGLNQTVINIALAGTAGVSAAEIRPTASVFNHQSFSFCYQVD